MSPMSPLHVITSSPLHPEHVRLFTITAGVAGSLLLAWRLSRRAIQTVWPSAVPGEDNPLLIATPYENITTKHENDDDVSSAEEYDVVIVGGGTAGCVLASRLSEDPACKVLLIEAGKSDLLSLATRIPASHVTLQRSEVDWGMKTEPEPEMHNRQMHWPRGKVLGGCSSINALMYVRGPAADYDEWAEKYSATGWSWKDLQPYFNKSENFTPTDEWKIDDSKHGKGGPWQIRYPPIVSKIVPAFLRGCKNIGIPTVADINAGQVGMVGATRIQSYIDDAGRRSSTATAYLTDEVCRRKNLKISVGMIVTRIITGLDANGDRVAKGVELASGPHVPVRYRVQAKRDVIVACGAVHTPHLLKLSGIGPKEELTRHGINVVKDLPGVGDNLQDHLLIPMSVNTAKGTSMNWITHPSTPVAHVLQWLFHGSGQLTSHWTEAVAWIRSHDDPDMRAKVEDLCSTPNEPDMELFSTPIFYKNMGQTVDTDPFTDRWTLAQVPLRPSSTGTITLADASPFSHPVIRANYFATENDRQLSIWAFKKLCAVAKASGVFVSWELPKRADQLDDDEILEFLKEHANTCYHASCTAAIGKEQDRGVVSTELAVHGIKGLRVCDASVMPRIISGHTCAPVIAIAERFSDVLKREYASVKA